MQHQASLTVLAPTPAFQITFDDVACGSNYSVLPASYAGLNWVTSVAWMRCTRRWYPVAIKQDYCRPIRGVQYLRKPGEHHQGRALQSPFGLPHRGVER